MDYNEFLALHGSYVTAMHAYIAETEKSCSMLGKCTADPLSLGERLNLFSQEIVENDAHRTYLSAKRLLHAAALLGYGSTN